MTTIAPPSRSLSSAGLRPVPLALTGPQKAAIIVRYLLAEGADLPLTALPDDVQAALTEQIGQMQMIDRDTLAGVVQDFCHSLDRVGLSFPGGVDAALTLLDGRISANAASRLRRLSGAAAKSDPWERIAALDVEKLVPVLGEESIEVAAVVLSKLPVPKAADLLGRLPGERARRIAWAISQTGGMDPATVIRIGQSLASQLDAQPVRAFDFDPVGRVGAILNISPAATRDDVLKGLEEDDQTLADQVRKTIFTFAHIPARIAARDVPKFLRGVDQDALVKALGGARGDEATAAAEFILANMSQRLATSIREEIAAAGKIRDKDAEAAQTAIVIAIRDLEAAGELALTLPEEEEAAE